MSAACTLLIAILVPILGFHGVAGEKIFFWMSIGSKSHFIVWQPLAFELAKRGHELTFVAPFESHELQSLPNVDYIHIPDNFVNDFINSTEVFAGKYNIDVTRVAKYYLERHEVILEHPRVKEFLTTRPKFDLSIISAFNNDVGIYLANEVLNSPTILYWVSLRYVPLSLAVGNPVNPSYIPVDFFHYDQYMNFFQRTINALAVIAMKLHQICYFLPQLEAQIEEKWNIPRKSVRLWDKTMNVSFAFFNNHPIFDGVSPSSPNSINIPGIHLRPAKPLVNPLLKSWLDEAEHGAILVSFGSILSSSEMPDKMITAFLEAFLKLNQRIIWKWENEDMEGKPDNVLLSKWLPQQDVLGHPNLKLFITHGGLMSIEESIYHGVPMLVMPAANDQFSNAKRVVRLQCGSKFEWNELSKDTLIEVIQSVLRNETITQRTQYYSGILRDEMVTSLEKSVYYAEYAMKYGGAPFLKSPAKSLYWFQYLCLDVALFLVSIIYVLYKVIQLSIYKLLWVPCFKRTSVIKEKSS